MSEEEAAKQRAKKERLEAWKRKREAEKAASAASAAPAPASASASASASAAPTAATTAAAPKPGAPPPPPPTPPSKPTTAPLNGKAPTTGTGSLGLKLVQPSKAPTAGSFSKTLINTQALKSHARPGFGRGAGAGSGSGPRSASASSSSGAGAAALAAMRSDALEQGASEGAAKGRASLAQLQRRFDFARDLPSFDPTLRDGEGGRVTANLDEESDAEEEEGDEDEEEEEGEGEGEGEGHRRKRRRRGEGEQAGSAAAERGAEAARRRQREAAEGNRAVLRDGEDAVMREQQQQPKAAAATAAAKQQEEDAKMDTSADVEEKKEEEEEEEELDPLDAFMLGVTKQVKQVNEADRQRFGTSASTSASAPGAPAANGSGAAGGKRRADGTIVGTAELSGEEDGDREGEEDDEEAQLSKLTRMQDILAAAAKGVKKRGLPPTDHSKVEYEPFRKAFYHAPAEIQDMTEEEADELRMELGAIGVRGKECPKPLTKWSHCGLPASCLEAIRRLGYEKPTPIQAQAIPAIMSGRDVIGVAKTGSGKTMAFLLPMFRHINDQRAVEPLEGPIALIMTPTRELAVQIYRESKPFLRGLGLRAACVYGGVPISEQIAEMKKTAEIVVGTPGRMIDLLTANQGRVTNLRRVTYLVLDEADRMFDMGFEPQVMNIVNNIRPDRQTVLFSATFPKQMESLARKVLKHKPLEIAVGGKSVVAPEIEQIVEVRDEESKFTRLLEILGQTYNEDEDARTLIFVDRQEAADDLLKELMRKGYPTMSIHGGKDQVDRDSTIADFKAGVVPIVTATSIAARGLDVKQLKLVINYDVPNHLEDYVHRAGRTGRAGNKGTCVTFVTPQQDRYARDIVAALTASNVAVPDDLAALAGKFAEKVKSGKAQAAGSGFGGKGLERLESDREKAMRAQKSAFGGDGGDGEDKGEKGADGESGKQAASKEGAAANAAAAEEYNELNEMTIEVKKGPAPDFVRENKVQADSSSGLAHAEKQQASMSAAIEAAKASGADTTKLAQALAKIQAMHAEKKAAVARDTEKQRRAKDPDATDYHAIVPINE